MTRDVVLGRGALVEIDVPLFDGTDTPSIHVLPIPGILAAERIVQTWWTPIWPIYELQWFRWLDVLPSASPDDVQLRLRLQNLPPPPPAFSLQIRIYCTIR